MIKPDLPTPAPPPPAVEYAHVCEQKWIEIPAGTRPRCGFCTSRVEQLRRTAAGHGTVAEIRDAIAQIDKAAKGVPFGLTVRLELEGVRAWVCPRSITIEGEPFLAELPNRRARRRARMRTKTT